MSGIWRCSNCGMESNALDPAWRWRGDAWEHAHGDGQGRIHELAQFFCDDPDRDALRAEIQHYKDRERHFAKALHVADGGTYRADWDAAISRVVDERDTALRDLAQARQERDAAREEARSRAHAGDEAVAAKVALAQARERVKVLEGAMRWYAGLDTADEKSLLRICNGRDDSGRRARAALSANPGEAKVNE